MAIDQRAVNYQFKFWVGKDATKKELDYWSKKNPDQLVKALKGDPRVKQRKGKPAMPDLDPFRRSAEEFAKTQPKEEIIPFEKTGLYNEKDTLERAKKEFGPEFAKRLEEETSRLKREQGRAKEDLLSQLEQSKTGRETSGKDLETQLADLLRGEEYAKTDLDKLLGDVGLGEQRTKSDLDKLLADIGLGEQRSKQDLDLVLADILKQRGLTTEESQKQLAGTLGQTQSDYLERGIRRGRFGEGLLGGAELYATNESNTALQRALQGYAEQEQNTQTGYQRSLQDYGTQRTSAQEAYNRALQDYGTQRSQSQQAYDRTLSSYGVRRTGAQEGYQRALEGYDTQESGYRRNRSRIDEDILRRRGKLPGEYKQQRETAIEDYTRQAQEDAFQAYLRNQSKYTKTPKY